MAEIDALGITDNTRGVVMDDNGHLTKYAAGSGDTQMIYGGGEGSTLQGGVLDNAYVRWPGMIEAGTLVGDIIHETDLFTTFARLAGALEHVPTDRIIDGVDQTSLLINGDSYSRRDYVHIYTGETYAATAKGRFKRH